MNSKQRHEARYQRRKAAREQRKLERNNNVGTLDEVFSYHDLYSSGKKCCNGVRYKKSTQEFELRLFSGTASKRKKILNKTYKQSKYIHFTINERGKTRTIDAPNINDRQIQKLLTKKVLLPLYTPEMIYNNGASQQGKGLDFTRRQLEQDLRDHYKKYGRDGYVILLDFTKFFPTVNHQKLHERHEKVILNDDLRQMCDSIVDSIPGSKGLPLGVEPSQAEMVAFPSPLDNYIKSQLSIKGAGHYVDDYYILIPPDKDPKEILELISNKAATLDLKISEKKTHVLKLSQPFRFCKAKYTLYENGHIQVNGNREGFKRDRRKLKHFYDKIQEGSMTYEDLISSTNGMIAYYEKFDDHGRVLSLKQLFYSIFGFSYEDCRKLINQGGKDELHSNS